MSGGSYNYIYSTLSQECEGYMHDAEMNDLIKDLCKVLHDLEWWQSCDSSEEDYRKTVAKFKEKWFQYSRKSEWIPVSERLPEEDKEVLIFTKDKEINKAYHTLKEWSDTQWEWFVFGTLGYSLTYSDDEVLAWQPLPEPYKAESEDKAEADTEKERIFNSFMSGIAEGLVEARGDKAE